MAKSPIRQGARHILSQSSRSKQYKILPLSGNECHSASLQLITLLTPPLLKSGGGGESPQKEIYFNSDLFK
jgi:hypothetical protein